MGIAFAPIINKVNPGTVDRVDGATIDCGKDLQHTGSSYNFRSEDTKPYDFFINPEETVLIMYGEETLSFYKYEYATAGDISTLFYTGISKPLTEFTQAIAKPFGFTLSPDGTKGIIIDQQKARSISMPAGFDLANLNTTGKFKNFNSINNKFARCEFNTDGSKLFMIGDGILGYADLPNLYDIDGAVISNQYKSTKYIDSNSGGTWNKNGSQYLITTINGMYELNTDEAYNLSNLYYTGVGSAGHQFGGTRNIKKLQFSNDETRVYGIAINDRIYEYEVSLINW